MAKRSMRPPEGPPPPAALTMPRLQADTSIHIQIGKGEELRQLWDPVARGAGEPATFAQGYTEWDKYNSDMLARMFTNREVADEYSYAGPAETIRISGPLGSPSNPLAELNRMRAMLDGKLSMLRSLRQRLELYAVPAEPAPPAVPDGRGGASPAIRRAAFIVHGHDEGARESTARVLQQLGVEPLILHEQPNKGRTIIEKFEAAYADVPFAVVLLTPDDVGGKDPNDLKPRARQNVIWELGMFCGRLGRSHWSNPGAVLAIKPA